MNEKIEQILKEFNEIRRKKNKLTPIDISILLIGAISYSAIWFVIFFYNKITFMSPTRITVISILIIISAMLYSIYRAYYEKEREYSHEDLKKIDCILRKHKVNTQKKRELLKLVIANSIESQKGKVLGISVLTGLMLSPVCFYVIDVILENGFIIKYLKCQKRWIRGPWFGYYIIVSLSMLFLICLINILHISINEEKNQKKDFLHVIDEINLWDKFI